MTYKQAVRLKKGDVVRLKRNSKIYKVADVNPCFDTTNRIFVDLENEDGKALCVHQEIDYADR